NDRFWYSGGENGDARFAWGDELPGIASFAATPGGSGATYVTDAEIRSLLEAAGVPAEPIPGRPLGPTGLRSLVLPAAIAASALVLLLVASIVGFILVRRRRSAGVVLPADGGSDPPEPPAQE